MTTTDTTPRTTLAFEDLMAGHATFTIQSRSTGLHHTYRIVASKDAHPIYGRTYFASLLTGDDNESSYTYIGVVSLTTGELRMTKASKLNLNTPAVKGLAMVLRDLEANKQPTWCDVLPSSTCLRCGRALTRPDSIHRNYGADCASILFG